MRHIINRAKGDYLLKEDFVNLYRSTARVLHAGRKYQYGNKHDLLKDGVNSVSKIINLLNHHRIQITDDDCFHVLMQTTENNDVQVVYLENVDLAEISRN